MILSYNRPETLAEALTLVAQGGTPLAGATALYTARVRRNLHLVDLTRAGLDTIRVEPDRITLGAMVTLTQILEADIPGMEGALLRRACNAITARPLRNAITVGGNIAHVVYWADLPVVLLALDATVLVAHHGAGEKELPIASCVELGRSPYAGGLITQVVIPRTEGPQAFGYERFSRVSGDYATATVAVRLASRGSVIEDVRIAVGAIQNRPIRMVAAEALLRGTSLTPEELEAVSDNVVKHAHFGPNFRAKVDFRRKLLRVLTKRSIRTAFDWSTREV